MFGNRIDIFSKALDASVIKEKAISNNLANVDTPGYKKVNVSFEDQFRQLLKANEKTVLKTSHPLHVQPNQKIDLTPSIEILNEFTMRNDGNNVDVDTEISEQVKNSLYYNALITNLNSELRLLQTAITGGR